MMLTRALLVVVLFFVLAPIVCSASESEALTQTPLKTDDVASLMQMIKELQDSVQPRAPTPIANWPGNQNGIYSYAAAGIAIAAFEIIAMLAIGNFMLGAFLAVPKQERKAIRMAFRTF